MKIKALSLFLALCLLLSACGAVPEKKKETETPVAEENSISQEVTFTDALGRSVTVQEPKRVAALLGSFAQVWTLAGGEVCATADDAWEDLQLDLPEDAVNLGGIADLSLEKLLESQPDLILASSNTRQHMEWKETLEATNIPTAYFDVSDFDDYLQMLEICTQITGREDLYQQNGLAVQEQINQVREKSKARLEQEDAPTVLFLRASAASILAKNSEGTVLGEMLKDLGCINIADSDESLLENLSIEHILQADPDYIFFVQRGDDTEGTKAHIESFMSENPAWSQLSAVKNGEVYYMDKTLFNLKPNNRWGEAYEQLEEILSHAEG